MTLTTQQDAAQPDTSCLEILEQEVRARPGIVDVELQPEAGAVRVHYDASQVNETQIEALMTHVGPSLQQRWETCTLRLDRQGGRSCESCALALERALAQQTGVRRAAASFRGGVLSVTYDQAVISPAQIVRQVVELGAPLAVPDVPADRWWAWARSHLPALLTAITLIGMVVGWVAGRVDRPMLMSISYAVAYLTGSYFGLQAGWQSLRRYTLDVDILMVLAAAGAAVVGEPFEGVMLLFLFSLSNVLQDYALDRTRNAISALMQLRPDKALVRRGEQVILLPVERILPGERVMVKPGERLPLDGVVREGDSHVDQSPITGESMPVHKEPGATVFAGSINHNGHLEIEVTRRAQDSTLARLIKLVEEAQSEKAHTQRFIDTAEQYYATGVIVLTVLAIVVPLAFLGEGFDSAFYRAMTIMVAASPCALVISTPATVLSAIGNGARRGVLFKGGVHVENAAAIQVVAFDKTGTLTQGRPVVTDIIPLTPAGEETSPEAQEALLRLAAAVESKSEHPLGQAIVQAAQQRDLTFAPAAEFSSNTGLGVMGVVAGHRIAIGNERFLATLGLAVEAPAGATVARLQAAGKTTVLIAEQIARTDGPTWQVIGVMAIADTLRPQAAQVIQAIRATGVARVVMLTGDHPRVAQAIAAEAGLDAFYAGLMPEDKVRLVKELQATYGPTAMVGDGINDAPALATARLGIAMGAAGTDVALESADLVLMSDNLSRIPYIFALGRQARRTLLINLTFALGMIVLMVGAIFFYDLPLPLAVLGHEGGTVLVSLNGLRLLAYRYPA